MIDLKIKSIKELTSEKDFFSKNQVNINSILGLGIGYVLEEAKIHDFTTPCYDFNTKKTLIDYFAQVKKIRSSDKVYNFFRQVMYADTNKYIASSANFPQLLNDNTRFPIQMYYAFGDLLSEPIEIEKKTELQFMELVMLSRLPYLYQDRIRDRFMKINADKLPERFIPLFELAEKQFI